MTESKHWTATQTDRLLRVEATVTVANPGVTPLLVPSRIQDRSSNMNLDLVLEQEDGIHLAVMTDKPVVFEKDFGYPVRLVVVIHDGKAIETLRVNAQH
ncbi:hypothetical protein Q7C30_013270 [Pseudomonas sp. RAC1]|uniref:hypothetical protein n=1 Tax=Pseudomonas sp. RAC1 TaxID=3064900 RepID=UPI00271983E5|nr:hypothetical protein [Pseudomonas sp. RAC1]MDV9033070.1 hypothetical protein [Pseudomonas sp. RAC1]